MNSEFTHQEFFASTWETKLRTFIDSLESSSDVIWYQERKHKKINEELATLGYYVKYRYAESQDISFKLNEIEGKVDGWVYQNGQQIESIQIAIAYREKEEAEIDRRLISGEDFVVGGWVIGLNS